MAWLQQRWPVAVVLMMVHAWAAGVRGQDAERATHPAPVLTPPVLLEFAEADYPEEARESGLDAAVELELTVGADGAVRDVRVVVPAGHGFDEAAARAAGRFVFEPARRDGEPVPAVIRYRYVFELREAPSAAPPEARPGELDVTEREELLGDSGDGDGDDGDSGDGDGEDGDGDGGDRDDEDGEGDGGEPAFGAVARVEAPPREVVRRTIEREELTRVPGTRGDALRTVELLPGVGRPPFGAGLLVVRGSAPQDSEVFFEGIPVPLLYHFGGLTSFVNSRLLERIDFYPGNFSARYGRRVGGVLDVVPRDPSTEAFHGIVDLNVIDASILAEGPLGDDVALAVALRRSHIDAVFGSVVPDDAFDVVAAPVYWDYQTFLTWRPSKRDRVRLMVYGSSDRFEVILNDPVDSDPAIRGDVDLNTQFHYVQASWERKLSATVEQDVVVAAGPQLLDFRLGEDIRFDMDAVQVYGRAEWRARLSPGVRIIGGLDLFVLPLAIDFRGPPPRQSEGSGAMMEPLAGAESVAADVRAVAFRPAAYFESDLRPFDPLQVVLGLRLDYYEEIEEWTFDPRLVAFYSVSPATRVKFGAGIFSQPPDLAESSEDVGNPNLEPMHAVHLGAGVEHDFEPGVSVGAEGFYKRLWDRVVETEGGLPPRFVNDGIGRIYGLEVAGRLDPEGARYFGMLSYTLSRSERRDGAGRRWRLFDFDQTHILSVAGMYRFEKGWELGATFRFVTGNPRTPVVQGIYDANNDVYRPLHGPTNSERGEHFHRLDVRVEKKWDFESWRLALYLDIQNIYNARNPEGRIYNHDFSESSPVRGLPIIPSLGIRGEM